MIGCAWTRVSAFPPRVSLGVPSAGQERSLEKGTCSRGRIRGSSSPRGLPWLGRAHGRDSRLKGSDVPRCSATARRYDEGFRDSPGIFATFQEQGMAGRPYARSLLRPAGLASEHNEEGESPRQVHRGRSPSCFCILGELHGSCPCAEHRGRRTDPLHPLCHQTLQTFCIPRRSRTPQTFARVLIEGRGSFCNPI